MPSRADDPLRKTIIEMPDANSQALPGVAAVARRRR